MHLVTVAPGYALDRGPAASYARMRSRGMPAGITSAYRTPQYQQQLRERWLAEPARYAFAQPPERSRHVAGMALDLPRSPEAWLRAHPEHGWRFTDPKERWHAEYFPHLDQHLTDGTTPPAPPREAEDMPLTQADAEWIQRIVAGELDKRLRPAGDGDETRGVALAPGAEQHLAEWIDRIVAAQLDKRLRPAGDGDETRGVALAPSAVDDLVQRLTETGEAS